MRKLLALSGAVVSVALVVGSGATALAQQRDTPTKKPPPVKLSGKVNNHGSKSVKGGSLTVEQDDFYFNPTFIKAKHGRKITVKLKNEGSTQHTFTIDSLNIDQVVDPGKRASIKVTVPDSGAVQFYCRFHKVTGMQGAIFGKNGEKVGAGGSSTSSGTSPPASSTGSSSGY
jgi:plastocyanin